jgi:hypoxia up-regulated 1
VQAAIKTVLGSDEKIAQNVNADEGAVLGAAYYGAALSRQFKMKKLEVKELSMREYTYSKVGDESKPKVLFPIGTPLGTKRTLTFPAFGDIALGFAERFGSSNAYV